MRIECNNEGSTAKARLTLSRTFSTHVCTSWHALSRDGRGSRGAHTPGLRMHRLKPLISTGTRFWGGGGREEGTKAGRDGETERGQAERERGTEGEGRESGRGNVKSVQTFTCTLAHICAHYSIYIYTQTCKQGYTRAACIRHTLTHTISTDMSRLQASHETHLCLLYRCITFPSELRTCDSGHISHPPSKVIH